MNDTDKQSDAVRLHILRGMRPGRRLMMAAGWSTALRHMSRAGLRQQFKGASDELPAALVCRALAGARACGKSVRPVRIAWMKHFSGNTALLKRMTALLDKQGTGKKK